ncbi:hypothetical protein GCM10028858_00110 [Halorubrum pallidum]
MKRLDASVDALLAAYLSVVGWIVAETVGLTDVLRGFEVCSASPAEEEVEHQTEKRCEERDDRPQERRLVAAFLRVGVDPDDYSELYEQYEKAEQERGDTGRTLQQYRGHCGPADEASRQVFSGFHPVGGTVLPAARDHRP